MTKTMWVVMERSFEYNDEGYDTSEGGNAVIAFSSEKAAQAEALKRTLAVIREGRAADYLGYSFDSFVGDFEPLAHVDCDRFYSNEVRTALENLSDEDTLALAERLGDFFFMVSSVELTTA